MKKKSLCLFVILSVLLALVGCSKGSSSGSSAAAPAETEAAAPVIESAGTVTSTGSVKSAEVDETTNYKDTVIIGIANDVNNLDPQGSNTDANMMVFYLTHERLVNIDPDTNEVIPALAESWTVSEDGCVYDFTLAADATFTDGTPCTAEDVKFTYDRAKDSSFAMQKVADVVSVEAVDPTHVRITLSKPNQDWLTLMAHGGMSILSKAACEKDPVKVAREAVSTARPTARLLGTSRIRWLVLPRKGTSRLFFSRRKGPSMRMSMASSSRRCSGVPFKSCSKV